MAGVALLGVGVHVHLADDQPAAIGLPLQNAQRVVVAHRDRATAEQALPFDAQMGGHGDDVAAQAAQPAQLLNSLPTVSAIAWPSAEGMSRRLSTVRRGVFKVIPSLFKGGSE